MEKLLEQIKQGYEAKDAHLIQRAFDVAQKAHGTQRRESSEPFIVHPIHTAKTIAQMQMSAETIAAALLHDVVDDTKVSQEEIEKEFGKDIGFLVAGVSKLGRIKYRGIERQAENIRKMLVAMAEDIRVLFIKIADRLHNMQTLDALPERKQKRIALETMEIYAPITKRLGITELAEKLEDLAFPFLYPDAHKYVMQETERRYPEQKTYLQKVRRIIFKELAKENVRPREIQSRAKNPYSLWKKLEKHEMNWGRIYDFVAIRIIVNNVEECYRVLGLLHKLWRPLPGRIKDYIALPKPNGYQSLHTTVFCAENRPTEFQIRTPQMHQSAEYGIAAHWVYKENGLRHKNLPRDKKYNWIRQLKEWQEETGGGEELLENLKLDLFKNHIFAFTPRGDVVDLPEGATPVDFAYSIHSDLGNHCQAAKINGKIAPLSQELANGDVVEITPGKNKNPSVSWLDSIKTNAARSHIRKWLKESSKDEHLKIGLQTVNQELKECENITWDDLPKAQRSRLLRYFPFKSLEDLLTGIGRGDVSVRRVINRLFEQREKPLPATKHLRKSPREKIPVNVSGEQSIKTKIARCCNPLPGEQILAYVARAGAASVHRNTCPALLRFLRTRPQKILPAQWADKDHASETKYQINLNIAALDRVGLLSDISSVMSALGINILSVNSSEPEAGNKKILLSLEIQNAEQLRSVIGKLKNINNIIEVRRG